MTRLSCRVDGPADAPAVVLLHAIATHGEMWRPQLAAWSTGWRIVRPDFAGHGRSPAPEGAQTLADMARQVADALDTLGIERAALAGVSLGGMVAQAFAIAYPGRTRALVLAHTSARTEPAGRAIWDERLNQARAQGMAAQVEPTLARWFTPGFAARAPMTMEWVAAQIRATSAAGYAAAVGAIQGLDHVQALAALRVPALVVAGTADVAVPVAASESLARCMQGARLALLDGAPHLGNIEQPVEFTETVGAFLRASLSPAVAPTSP